MEDGLYLQWQDLGGHRAEGRTQQVGDITRHARLETCLMKRSTLLTIDALINLALGILLILFPFDITRVLGVSVPENAFYTSILGAVLVGIGLALLIEAFLHPARMRGLGLGGAISINLCGAIILVIWLVGGKLNLPLRGNVFLWGLVIVLISISTLEGLAQFRFRKG